MNVCPLRASKHPNPRRPRRLPAATFVVLAVTLLAGCGGGGGGGNGGPVAAPSFTSLLTPAGPNNWTTFTSLSPPPEVLPVGNRGVRVLFTAPGGSVFLVSLRDPATSAVTSLPQNTGGNPAPEAGYFAILNEDVSTSPAKFDMYVRAPEALSDPLNYDIEVVHESLRTDMTDSSAMVVPLRKHKIFVVNVSVQGGGHVTSSPAGIQCGTTSGGQTLTNCSHDFGPGPGPISVTLLEGSNTNNQFQGWAGNCAPNIQNCTLSLDGTSSLAATAIFGTSTAPASTCPTAPTLAGLRWIDVPGCATGVLDEHPGITLECDANGYFCCEPATSTHPGDARCGGQHESLPDCLQHAPKGQLHQPGGCYEVDTFP